ncbi:MAG: RNA polymerase subunit sigma-70, partial [Gammaproteobacteria bacterium]|nr:RNA polymerase subunit sigma-70 [Gammaproteobacteria bacterium]
MGQDVHLDINVRSANLLARIALRDRSAFEALYRLVSAKLNAVALKMLGSQDAAADVLQESFMQIWHNAASYRAELGEPLTWMRAIVRYRALDRVQAGKRRPEDGLDDEAWHRL